MEERDYGSAVTKTIPERICICRICGGSGKALNGDTCPQCEGSGRVVCTSEVVTYVRPYRADL